MKHEEFGAFLVRGPLYRLETITNPTWRQQGEYFGLQVPNVVTKHCATCGPTNWEITNGPHQNEIGPGPFHLLQFRCRNCGRAQFFTWVVWTRDGATARVMKVGQSPKMEITIPKEFDKALGERKALYVKGMTLRHNGYGIGAMTYFRRVIEDTTDDMLDLLEDTMKSTGADPGAIQAVQDAKKSKRFEDKVKIAADVMPAHLRPGGVNPFGDLYQLVSIGLHDLTDEECCDIVDAMDESLKFIYTQLKTHAEDAKAYKGAVAKITAAIGKFSK
jgi:hypothetical protein